jgi:MFS family permease
MTIFGRTIPASDPPPAHRWAMVIMVMLLMAVDHGVIASISVFDSAILKDLDVSRGVLKFRDMIQIASAGLSAATIGYWVDRVGVRPIMVAGMSLLAVVLAVYSHVGSIAQVYVLHALLGVSYASVHVVGIGVLVSGWFPTRKRGPMGVALSGTSFGSAVLPQITAALLGAYGWRGSILVLAAPPLVMLLLAMLVIRQRRLTGAGESAAVAEGPTWSQAMRQIASFEFALLTVAAFGVYYAGSSFTAHSFLYVKDQGATVQAAAMGMTVIFTCGLVGKIGSGFLAERWGSTQVWLADQALFLAGGLALTLIGPKVMWPALAAIGLGWGGCYTLTQVLIAERFLGPSLGKLIGLFALIEGLGAGSGSWLTGVMFDHTGAYRTSFMVDCTILVVSISATALTLRRPRPAV